MSKRSIRAGEVIQAISGAIISRHNTEADRLKRLKKRKFREAYTRLQEERRNGK